MVVDLSHSSAALNSDARKTTALIWGFQQSGRCFLSAAALAGVVSAFAESGGWCARAVLDVAWCAVCAPVPPPPSVATLKFQNLAETTPLAALTPDVYRGSGPASCVWSYLLHSMVKVPLTPCFVQACIPYSPNVLRNPNVCVGCFEFYLRQIFETEPTIGKNYLILAIFFSVEFSFCGAVFGTLSQFFLFFPSFFASASFFSLGVMVHSFWCHCKGPGVPWTLGLQSYTGIQMWIFDHLGPNHIHIAVSVQNTPPHQKRTPGLGTGFGAGTRVDFSCLGAG